jgi:hypothetical protein
MKVKRKKLKIAIVSKLWEETSPNSRGGTGSSIGLLVNALVERGHHVTLFATGNSKTKAQKLVVIILRCMNTLILLLLLKTLINLI